MKAEILAFKESKDELSYDDIVTILNPIQYCDLKQILLMTNVDRRLNVALAFSGINVKNLLEKSDIDIVSGKSWIYHRRKLPLGAAFRLSKVFGVAAEILFASPLYYGKKEQDDY